MWNHIFGIIDRMLNIRGWDLNIHIHIYTYNSFHMSYTSNPVHTHIHTHTVAHTHIFSLWVVSVGRNRYFTKTWLVTYAVSRSTVNNKINMGSQELRIWRSNGQKCVRTFCRVGRGCGVSKRTPTWRILQALTSPETCGWFHLETSNLQHIWKVLQNRPV